MVSRHPSSFSVKENTVTWVTENLLRNLHRYRFYTVSCECECGRGLVWLLLLRLHCASQMGTVLIGPSAVYAFPTEHGPNQGGFDLNSKTMSDGHYYS